MPLRHTLLAFLLFGTYCRGVRESGTPDRWKGSLGDFFSSVDLNDDGQIEPQEAAKYIGDGVVGDQDLQCMQYNVDGADNGDTISEGELQQHLQSLMKVAICACKMHGFEIVNVAPMLTSVSKYPGE